MCFTPSKTVILPAPACRGSEARRRSIAQRRVYGAKSKDLDDGCWRMLFRAFGPQIRGVEGPRGASILLMPLTPFQPPKPAPGGPATVRRFCTDLGMEHEHSA